MTLANLPLASVWALALVSLPPIIVDASFLPTRPALLRVRVSLWEQQQYPILGKEDDIMNPKAHGTSHKPVQDDLKWGMDFETANRICNYNRRYAEYKGTATNLLNMIERQRQDEVYDFYDSVTGNLLFTAPQGRSLQEFTQESHDHGWPSFRDAEVNWDFVRCLEGPEGECVSITGTHLGHNLPDEKGNRYCINLVSIAGRPPTN
ncbi:expressed unknown protein [Seminavis robusta]|uniref:Uncharacterized protein n=1 Tax=Seminavis robusta TaxID=568900 RepID=A0A9N8HGZ2_9STRA|nr:expressed unknown protein [Seminavis robusta]|eukprot:Sro422_g139610.1 n/a (206) ;mRNA; r:681-1298